MSLPFSENLPIYRLASVFNNTSATYKFYWLISIIELVEKGIVDIPKEKIFARMISNSWYTINYFHISFGKQDKFQNAVQEILIVENLTIDEKKDNLNIILEESKTNSTIKNLSHFDKNVPHWFLAPWFSQKNRKGIYTASQNFENDCLYALYSDRIIINPKWVDYIKTNSKILKNFCYWNLTLFLQTRNPNVPDIPNKLIKPAIRNSLTRQTNDYWKLVFQELGSINCIFTNAKLSLEDKNFALDHFIPYAFVSHDLIWNLVPIEKRFNSSKSDKLPRFETYFPKFYQIQKTAFEINKNHNSKGKYMEEFLTIFPCIDEFKEEIFSNTIQPLLSIANNNGFLYLNE